MITGETVFIEHQEQAGTDSFNEPIYEQTFEEVANVLVAPSSSSDVDGSTRPNGTQVSLTLHFPKGFNQNMSGKHIKVRNELYKVIGDPKPYTLENTPGDWWYPVEVEKVDG